MKRKPFRCVGRIFDLVRAIQAHNAGGRTVGLMGLGQINKSVFQFSVELRGHISKGNRTRLKSFASSEEHNQKFDD